MIGSDDLLEVAVAGIGIFEEPKSPFHCGVECGERFQARDGLLDALGAEWCRALLYRIEEGHGGEP